MHVVAEAYPGRRPAKLELQQPPHRDQIQYAAVLQRGRQQPNTRGRFPIAHRGLFGFRAAEYFGWIAPDETNPRGGLMRTFLLTLALLSSADR
jgi:hypothetical protein